MSSTTPRPIHATPARRAAPLANRWQQLQAEISRHAATEAAAWKRHRLPATQMPLPVPTNRAVR